MISILHVHRGRLSSLIASPHKNNGTETQVPMNNQHTRHKSLTQPGHTEQDQKMVDSPD